jgi:protein transport protein SEC20
MTASGDVTSALQRAVTLMSIELEKSSYSSQLLDESSMSIQQATLEYTSFTSLVSSSTKLIKSMERADFYDAIMLSLSFLFFIGCIAYIVKVRVWDKGVGLLSFIIRMGGLGSGASAGANVKEKLLMAKEAAAKELQASKAAQLTKFTLVNTVASAAASAASIASASAASAASAASSIASASSMSAASSASAGQTVEAPSPVVLEDIEIDSIAESTTLPLPVASQEHALHHDEL